MAFEGGDAVGLEQSGDAAGQVLDDVGLALDHRRHVHGHAFHLDAVDLKGFLGFVVLVGAVQQRLGRDAAYVQAGTAESDLAVLADVLLDAGSLQAELGGTDGGNVTARASANHNHVEFLAHIQSLIPVRRTAPCGGRRVLRGRRVG
ncbi:hypothetical protein D3C78_764180 [compost metagenome]